MDELVQLVRMFERLETRMNRLEWALQISKSYDTFYHFNSRKSNKPRKLYERISRTFNSDIE